MMDHVPWIEFCEEPTKYNGIQYNKDRDEDLVKSKEYHEQRFDEEYTGGKQMKILIFIKTMDDETYEIDCFETDFILTIKILIEKKYGILLNKQKLIWCGKELKDERTLSDYNIQYESTLRLLVTN